ncbi:helix-turn-helix domain-containing protein [Lacticaseibacillus songhuajiangensis]|jgi:hypothetical protein|uniref:helix-turn-helix domain-containing protein n=1 Tax=Lacticaseibacillus songhuajiangensis TaxID=1296539 RepID=UPI000F78F787|nr:helix-turn-helix transcriptional regulator [Lacticaseibacillus songhuajiangensis]
MLSQPLNKLVKHLRHDRGLTLEEIRGQWTTATMSRFERGEIDLADDVAAQLQVPLGLDYEDLIVRHIVSDEDLNDWQYLASEMWSADHAQVILNQLNKLAVPGARNGFLKVASAVIEELLRIHYVGSQNMKKSVINELDKYLANLSEFGRLEGILFSVCTEYVPAETGWHWVSRQIEMANVASAPPQLTRRLISFGANVAERAAIEQNFKLMRGILDVLWKLDALIPENAFQRYNLQLLEALFADLTTKSATTHRRLIEVTRTGRIIFSAKSHESMVRATIKQGWASAADFNAMM